MTLADGSTQQVLAPPQVYVRIGDIDSSGALLLAKRRQPV